MEVVMAAQLSAGIRGLQCVYNAVGLLLPDWQDHPVRRRFPLSGLRFQPRFGRTGPSTRELTADDVQSLNDWYMRTLGEVPRSVTSRRGHPRFLKAPASGRPRFAGAAQADDAVSHAAPRDDERPARRPARGSLLAGAWGVSREWVVRVITGTSFYFTGLEALNVVDEAIGGHAGENRLTRPSRGRRPFDFEHVLVRASMPWTLAPKCQMRM